MSKARIAEEIRESVIVRGQQDRRDWLKFAELVTNARSPDEMALPTSLADVEVLQRQVERLQQRIAARISVTPPAPEYCSECQCERCTQMKTTR
jgi:hypothetical protein